MSIFSLGDHGGKANNPWIDPPEIDKSMMPEHKGSFESVDSPRNPWFSPRIEFWGVGVFERPFFFFSLYEKREREERRRREKGPTGQAEKSTGLNFQASGVPTDFHAAVRLTRGDFSGSASSESTGCERPHGIHGFHGCFACGGVNRPLLPPVDPWSVCAAATASAGARDAL